LSTRINEFVFKGILTTHAKRELEAAGLLRTPSMTVEERHDQDLFAAVSASVRGASVQMQRCYRLLFVFENLVREFIMDRLYESDGADWFDKRATAAMKKKYEDRKKAEESNQWHTGRNTGAIYYLDFGDLGLLIINHCADFKDLLPSQAWLQSRIQEAERTRNVIAHTNTLTPEETDRLEMYLRDWVRQVG
jgi:Swt1-like HEPN